ncbi:NAD(P)H-dependent oxidoreductase [Sphingopyxis sp. MWB1]|uniref:NAD(P)H-dependent oxidoreductase n=1 Tax=Sphingopyxis sp. MWB1 TaxID=1537715 RepID=UPI00051A5DA8|nr:NAD(P)H-dependent oxidoreductase [Sphingopyxis sp. MWB1]
MHSLIALSHPNPASLTHAVATALREAILAASPGNSVETADLHAEGFDPRFSPSDAAHFAGTAPLPASIRAEQARIDRADALILVYPVYWWTMPALMKGWIDRVFANGWAYVETAEGKVEKRLQRLSVHLVAIGAADLNTYAKYGYDRAMQTQIETGIFGYCGANIGSSTLLPLLDTREPGQLVAAARDLGTRIGTPHAAAEASAA